MTNVTARIKVEGKHFEILVDVDKALEFKKSGTGGAVDFLETDVVFTNIRNGDRAGESDLKSAFGTNDINKIAEEIVKRGEMEVPVEIKNQAREGKVKQVIDFFVKNAVNPQNDMPYTPDRIAQSLSDAGVNVENKPIEPQIKNITEKLSVVIPLKVETKKLLITIPAQYTGQIYGLINNYKENEEWLGNGDLKVTVNVPVGLQMEFYDKLNSITHGSALSEEIKENE